MAFNGTNRAVVLSGTVTAGTFTSQFPAGTATVSAAWFVGTLTGGTITLSVLAVDAGGNVLPTPLAAATVSAAGTGSVSASLSGFREVRWQAILNGGTAVGSFSMQG
jgi:hypothetical protein